MHPVLSVASLVRCPKAYCIRVHSEIITGWLWVSRGQLGKEVSSFDRSDDLKTKKTFSHSQQHNKTVACSTVDQYNFWSIDPLMVSRSVTLEIYRYSLVSTVTCEKMFPPSQHTHTFISVYILFRSRPLHRWTNEFIDVIIIVSTFSVDMLWGPRHKKLFL